MPKPRLLDQLRDTFRVRLYSLRTEEAYVQWRKLIRFHEKRHPGEKREADGFAFLTHLAVNKHVAESKQNQACAAILFLHEKALAW